MVEELNGFDIYGLNGWVKWVGQLWQSELLFSVASFPDTEKGGGEKERLVSTVCACVLISKNSWKTVSLVGISVTLTYVRLPIFTVWKMHTTATLCVNDDEGARNALSFSVARMIHAFCPFQLNATTSDDVIFPLKFTDASNKTMQTITVKAI